MQVQLLLVAPSVSVEKSFDFSADFRIFEDILTKIEQEKDLAMEIAIDEVFIFAQKRERLFILHDTKK